MLKWPCSSLVKEHDFYPGTEQMLWGACMLLPTQCPRLVQTPLAIAERVRKDGAKVLREALSTWKPWIPPGVLTCSHHSPHRKLRHHKIFLRNPIQNPVPPQCLCCKVALYARFRSSGGIVPCSAAVGLCLLVGSLAMQARGRRSSRAGASSSRVASVYMSIKILQQAGMSILMRSWTHACSLCEVSAFSLGSTLHGFSREYISHSAT